MINFLEIKKTLYNSRLVPSSFCGTDNSSYYFRWISECSADVVLELRNAPHVLEFSDTKRLVCAEDHESFLACYESLPRLDYLICSRTEGEYIGGVSLVETDYGLEIGKYVGKTKYLGRGIGKASVLAFIEFIKLNLPSGQKILAKTKRQNYRNIALNEDLGFMIEDELPGGFILMGFNL